MHILRDSIFRGISFKVFVFVGSLSIDRMLTWQQILMQQHVRSFQLHFFLRETSLKYKCRIHADYSFYWPAWPEERLWRYVGLRVWSEFWRWLENMEVGRCCLWRRGSAPTPQLPAPLPSLVQSCRSCCFTSQRWYRRNFGGKAAKEAFSKQWSN